MRESREGEVERHGDKKKRIIMGGSREEGEGRKRGEKTGWP